MARLRPCGSCARHVRFEETACPFCGRALGAEARDAGSGRAAGDLGRPLSRSAVVFVGATTLAACVGGPGDLPTGSSGNTTSSGSSGSDGNGSSSGSSSGRSSSGASGSSTSSSGSSASSTSGGSSSGSSGASGSSTTSSGASGSSGTSGGPVPLYGPAIIDAGQ